MPWFRKLVYTDNTIILYFLCLTTKILLYYYCRNFPNGQPDFPNMPLILKKVGGLTTLQYSSRYGPARQVTKLARVFTFLGPRLFNFRCPRLNPSPLNQATGDAAPFKSLNT
jgi:hypothetical protein